MKWRVLALISCAPEGEDQVPYLGTKAHAPQKAEQEVIKGSVERLFRLVGPCERPGTGSAGPALALRAVLVV